MEKQCKNKQMFSGGGYWLLRFQRKRLVQEENHRNVKPDYR